MPFVCSLLEYSSYHEDGGHLRQCTVEGNACSFWLLFNISQGVPIAAISSRIRILNTSKLCGRLLNTFSFRYHHRKMSQMEKKSERWKWGIMMWNVEVQAEGALGGDYRTFEICAHCKARCSPKQGIVVTENGGVWRSQRDHMHLTG